MGWHEKYCVGSFKKLKTRTTKGSNNSASGNLPRRIDITLIFIVALFTRAGVCKQPKCPSTDEWMENMWSKYII